MSISFLLCTSLIGIIFVISGFILYKKPPGKINHLYGYRTSSSMKSQERWDFAQKHSAKIMYRHGIYMILMSLFGLVLPISETVGSILSIGIMLFFVYKMLNRVEKDMIEQFEEA
jgi:uncharacterized membrane protein